MDIGSNGKINPTPAIDDERFGQYLTELTLETNWRGLLTQDLRAQVQRSVFSYYDNGEPPGVSMFENFKDDHKEYLYKFSKKEYVEDMYKFGKFRISPATYYSKGSHLKAVKDFETNRGYKLKGLVDVMNGNTYIELNGANVPIENGFVEAVVFIDDYYLFSTSNQISRRMPTDFEADSVLIVNDKAQFIARMKKALEYSRKGWEFLEDNVRYYDPYNDIPKDTNQEFYKHISYAYQREHRCILRSSTSRKSEPDLEAFFVEIGSVEDIAEVRYAS